MRESAVIRPAVGRILWGYVFIYLDINLGRLNILPDALGYLLILQALASLKEIRPSAGLLKTPGTVIAVWEAGRWILSLAGAELDGPALLQAAGYLIGVLSLYFHFQLLGDLAGIAAEHGYEQSVAGPLRRLRNTRTVLMTLLLLPFPWQESEGLILLILGILLFLILWTFLALGAMRRAFAEEDENGDK